MSDKFLSTAYVAKDVVDIKGDVIYWLKVGLDATRDKLGIL